MLDQRLTLKQKQELALKPKMLQSLKMLALPILELEAYIKQELVNNPLLELRDDKDEEEESLDESSFEGSQPESKQALDDIEDLPEHNSTLSEAKELTEILDQWNDYHQSYEWSQGRQDAEQGESLIRYEENLLDKYLEQLYPLSLAENEMEFAADLVDSCDNYGFLPADSAWTVWPKRTKLPSKERKSCIRSCCVSPQKASPPATSANACCPN